MELALVLPFIFGVLLLVVQVLLVAHGQVLVEQAARRAARQAAVDPDPAAASRSVAAGQLDPGRTWVDVHREGGLVTVRVRHRLATDLPLLGPLVPDVDLAGEATFRVESLMP